MPKKKLTVRTTNFSKEILCAISAVVVGLFLACMAPNAHAGEFKSVVPSVTTEPEYLWNGPYLALNSGAVWTNCNISGHDTRVDLTRQFNEFIGAFPEAPTSPPAAKGMTDIFFSELGHSSTSAVYIGGADLGYNFQFGHFVIGAGFGFSGTRTTNESVAQSVTIPPFTFTISNGINTANTEITEYTAFRRVEQDWSGYAGAQAGFAWRRLLVYATGGSAFSHIDVQTFDGAATQFSQTIIFEGTQHDRVSDSGNNVLTGCYAGGGVQFAFTDAIRAGLEYRHADFGDRLYHFSHSTSEAVFPSATRVDVHSNEVLFKVTVMLGHLGKATK
jgi:outer membrane immunogenic protein